MVVRLATARRLLVAKESVYALFVLKGSKGYRLNGKSETMELSKLSWELEMSNAIVILFERVTRCFWFENTQSGAEAEVAVVYLPVSLFLACNSVFGRGVNYR